MLGLLSLIPGLFTTINGVTSAISNERLKLIAAKTDSERIKAEENIASLSAKRDVLVAESAGSKINTIIRATMGCSVSILVAKLLVWDKALGEWTGGRVEALDDNLWWIVTTIIAFYFLSDTVKATARIIKS